MKSLEFVIEIFLLFTTVLGFIDSISLCASSNKLDSSFPGASDLVQSLPNVSLPLGKNYTDFTCHYSGFLKTSGGSYLYYWFFTSKSESWQTDPVVLWLSGARVSSVTAALTEIGPFVMTPNGTLVSNQHSWNQKANLLLIDTPVDVGPSHTYEMLSLLFDSDAQSVVLNFNALQSFYRKFPQFLNNDFYLAGQGYASVPLVTLAKELVEERFPKNFKGVSIGNGIFNVSSTINSHLEFLFKNLFKNETKIFDRVIKSCCPSTFCKSSDECSFRECPIIHNNTESACYKSVFEVLTSTFRNMSIHNIDQNCSMYVDQSRPTCDHILVTNKTKIWFRSDPVREALNLTENGWLAANVASYFRYANQFSVLHGHLMFLLRNRIRVALYYGDRDATVGVFNGHWLLDELALSPIYSEFQPFNYEGQLAGVQQQFREGLTFSVVHNAGFYVPVDKPGPALKLFNDFLRGDNDNLTDVSRLSTCSKYCYPALKSDLPISYEPKLDDLEIWYWVRAYRHLYWPWPFIMPEHY